MPTGVLGTLAALAVSPPLGAAAGFVVTRVCIPLTARARRGLDQHVRRAEWGTAFALAYSHGANDAQKTMGVVTLLLVSTGHLGVFAVPLWVKLAASSSLVLGTAMGGWRIVRTLGHGIYRMRPIDGLVSQSSSAGLIFGAAALGAPVSTTHVVASSVAGVGLARRAHHVHWHVVAEMAAAWLVTLPVAAATGALLLPLWEVVT
jgi:PiT family inorganic phosphate transporter